MLAYHADLENVEVKIRLGVLIACLFASSSVLSPSATAVSTNPSQVCVGNSCSVTFPFSGDYYQWSAPVTGTYTFQVWGAQGGNAGYNGTSLSAGALGGFASGQKVLTVGDTVYIYVGGQGEGQASTSFSDFLAGGFNGGGIGQNGKTGTANNRAAGGGGATDIRLVGNALSNRVIVAGGGGGGAIFQGYGINYPGVGGGIAGGNGGTANYPAPSEYSGFGGTQSAGGAGGRNGAQALAGSLGSGGRGSNDNSDYGSSGGGGGYWGGGGAGWGMGSGGGSGYVGGVLSSTLTAGNATMPNPSGGTMTGRTGSGIAKISYSLPSTNLSIAISGGATTTNKGSVTQIIATTDGAGFITFYVGTKKIAGCIRMFSNIGTRTCSWKSTYQGSVKLSAYISASGSASGFSNAINMSVNRRTGPRG